MNTEQDRDALKVKRLETVGNMGDTPPLQGIRKIKPVNQFELIQPQTTPLIRGIIIYYIVYN